MAVSRLITISLIFATCVQAQTSSASWQFPVEDGLIINDIDTIVLQWTSNFPAAYLGMWCQNDESIGNDVSLGSMFQVNTSGTYPYIISRDDPDQLEFPVACHAQLVDAPNGKGSGPDSPVGVTFVSLSTATAAKTFSLSASTASAAALPTSTTSSSASTQDSTSSVTSTSSSSTSFSASSSTSPTISTLPTNTSPGLPTGTARLNPDGGLSTGAKAGISVAAAVVGLTIAGGISYLMLRTRRQSSQISAVPELEGKADLGPYGAPHYGRHELEDEVRRKFELEAAGHDRPELDNGEPLIFELPDKLT